MHKNQSCSLNYAKNDSLKNSRVNLIVHNDGFLSQMRSWQPWLQDKNVTDRLHWPIIAVQSVLSFSTTSPDA